VLCAAGAVVLATNWFRRLRPAIPAVVAVVYLVAAAIALPALDPLKSSRAFSTAVAAQVGQGELRGFHEWRWRAGYAFYARRPIPNLETLDELRAYWSRPERVFLIVERGRLVEARKVLGDAEPLVSSRIGSNEAFLFASRPATRAAALL